MMVMNGSADQGLIVHEVGHNYTMGILANNEWREGWLDEGFTSFQTTWFWETHGPDQEATSGPRPACSTLDLDGYSEPTSLVSEAYRDFTSYNISIYSRGELFFHQLRYIVGDAAMHRILQTYLRALEAQARGRGGIPGRGGGGVAAGSVDLLRPGAAYDASCTTMRWGR